MPHAEKLTGIDPATWIAVLEPDPEITWDDDRLTAARQALAAWSPPDV